MSSLPEYWTLEYLHTRHKLKEEAQKSSQEFSEPLKSSSKTPPRLTPTQPLSSTSSSLSASPEKYPTFGIQRLEHLKFSVKAKSAGEPFIIGVSGGSASGKTTVCHEIVKSLSNKRVIVVSQDSFYKNFNEEEKILAYNCEYDFDHPDAFEFELLEETLQKLKAGKNVKIPVYDFKTHSRMENECVHILGADVIILEGILIFYSKVLRDLMDLKIFVDTDADTRLVRRIYRDIKERGRDLEGVLTQYEKFVKPSFDDYIQPTKKYADIIIPRGGANTVAIDLLVQHVKSKLAFMESNTLI